MLVVIGSANSSNTQALTRLATEAGCPRVFRVNGAEELPDDLTGTVGVTAGASAPEELVEAVIARLSPRHGVEEVTVTLEEEYFPPAPPAGPAGHARAVRRPGWAPTRPGAPRSTTGTWPPARCWLS